MTNRSQYDETLRTQLRMNPETWAALQEHGVTEKTPLSLDFSYDAPSEDAATEIAAYLRRETDYSVTVEATRKGLRKQWTVEGTTQPLPVSLEMLDQWVTWMVQAGMQNGDCMFDGWGAKV